MDTLGLSLGAKLRSLTGRKKERTNICEQLAVRSHAGFSYCPRLLLVKVYFVKNVKNVSCLIYEENIRIV